MAKLTRESRLRERRLDKKARKDARKFAAANPGMNGELTDEAGSLASEDRPDEAESHPADATVAQHS